jgi:hypothetical protein
MKTSRIMTLSIDNSVMNVIQLNDTQHILFKHNNTQHNDAQHEDTMPNDNQNNVIQHMDFGK